MALKVYDLTETKIRKKISVDNRKNRNDENNENDKNDDNDRKIIVKDIALKVVRTGTDEINHKILKMLPTNIDNLMKEFKLTKVPVNIRVNALEKVGLVHRLKGTGGVEITDFGEFFLDKINGFEDNVQEHMYDILVKTLL